MKRRGVYVILLVVVIFSLGSCNRKKTIPDDTLSDIFRDMFIVNAYAGQKNMDWDSINIYEPILNDYGYDTDDFIHTVGGFSRRKSTRLSDIVDVAIKKLDDVSASLAFRARTLDRIDSIAYEMTKEVIYRDSLIQIRSKADSAKMEVTLPAKYGRYEIVYYYYLDSTDMNRNVSNRHFIRDSTNRSVANSTARFRQKERHKHTSTLEAPANAMELVLTFGNYPRQELKPMHADIDSLVITYYPPIEEALERLLRSHINYTLIIDGREYHEYYNLQADSSTLHVRPPLLIEEPDSVAVE